MNLANNGVMRRKLCLPQLARTALTQIEIKSLRSQWTNTPPSALRIARSTRKFSANSSYSSSARARVSSSFVFFNSKIIYLKQFLVNASRRDPKMYTAHRHLYSYTEQKACRCCSFVLRLHRLFLGHTHLGVVSRAHILNTKTVCLVIHVSLHVNSLFLPLLYGTAYKYPAHTYTHVCQMPVRRVAKRRQAHVHFCIGSAVKLVFAAAVTWLQSETYRPDIGCIVWVPHAPCVSASRGMSVRVCVRFSAQYSVLADKIMLNIV